MNLFSRSVTVCLALSLGVLTSTTQAQTQPSTKGVNTMNRTIQHADISLAQAQKLVQFGIEQAQAQSVNVVIAIVDRSGHLLHLSRMDEAGLVSIDVAIGKARTAAYIKAPSKKFEDFISNGSNSILATPNILPLQGGIPLVIDGQIVGAVGVSGAAGETDNAIAQAIADTL
ncbi:GlcG/HbpS family heme-binding protein [Lonepinella koalarum]